MTAASDPWLIRLEEGARLLLAGKAEDAAQVLVGLDALCVPSAPQPSQQVVAQARELLQRCFAAEANLRQRVVEDLNRLAAGKRAQIYRHPVQGPR